MGNFGSKNSKTSTKKCSLPEPIQTYPTDSTRKMDKKLSISAKKTPRSSKNSEFHKSLSMYELRRGKSRAGRSSITAESLPENDVHNDASPTIIKGVLKQSVRRLGSNGEEKK